MRGKLFDQLSNWRHEFRNSKNQRVWDLATMAYNDLMYGPFTAGEFAQEDPHRTTIWPGFSKACDEIKKSLEDGMGILDDL